MSSNPTSSILRTMTTATGIRVTFPDDDDTLEAQWDVSNLREDQRVPPPRYRHAAPSAPWPWMDFEHDATDVPPLLPGDHEPWSRYPQSHFGNWTPDQVRRCRMLTICKDDYACQIHRVDVFKDGTFDKLEVGVRTRRIPSDPTTAKEFWDDLQKPVGNLRVRALFIENISLNVLQILGARYNVEPFFFASSANWIPSRYQEDPHHGEGDHITVVLPFIRTVNNERERVSPVSSSPQPAQFPSGKGQARPPITDTKHTIDTQAPLVLSDEKILLQDLLAIHMVRNRETNTIVSYHHHSDLQKTTARHLRSLVQRTGDSVYWAKLYDKSKDPTFVFLAILWYALYAWDEALEVLYEHLSEQLEAKATDVKTNITHTRELHKLQAHLLYYQQLLRDFRKSVEFVRDTPNPAMYDDSISDFERESSKNLLTLESENLLSEIERLDKQRQIQSDRLQNAIELAFSTVHIEESRSMQELTQAAMRDSAAMKLIEYLTMIFVPANYLSSVFGMSVAEMNHATRLKTIGSYLEATVILTLITAWVIIALQDHSSWHPGGRHVVQRIAWPLFRGYDLLLWMVTAIKELFRRRRVT